MEIRRLDVVGFDRVIIGPVLFIVGLGGMAQDQRSRLVPIDLMRVWLALLGDRWFRAPSMRTFCGVVG